jgi:predicted nuclease with TOPRIM domain
MMHKKCNHLRSSIKAVKQDTSRLEEDLRSIELERESLKDRVERLKLFEQKYQHYMKREPEIRHYLAQYAVLAKYYLLWILCILKLTGHTVRMLE